MLFKKNHPIKPEPYGVQIETLFNCCCHRVGELDSVYHLITDYEIMCQQCGLTYSIDPIRVTQPRGRKNG